MLKTFSELEERMKVKVSSSRVAVVSAHDSHTLEAVLKAVRNGFVSPIQIGDVEKIKEVAKWAGLKYKQGHKDNLETDRGHDYLIIYKK
jgi:phosphate butyryltransferase